MGDGTEDEEDENGEGGVFDGEEPRGTAQKSESGANNLNTAGDGTKEELGMPALGVAGDDSADANGPTSSDIDDDEGYALGLGANQHTPRPGDPILKRSHHTYSPESDSASVAAVAAAAVSLQEPSVGSGSSVSFAPTTQEMLARRPPLVLGSSAPGRFLMPPGATRTAARNRQPLPAPPAMTSIPARASSASARGTGTSRSAELALLADDTVRRCQSVYEMRRGMSSSYGGITSSTPAYSGILQKKKSIEATLQERLSQRREASMKELLQVQDQMMRRLSTQSPRPLSPIGDELGHSQSSHSSSTLRMTNNRRKCRRAEHNRAVINDLCEIVADLFVAESKLLLHSARATTVSSAGFAGLVDGTSPDRGSVLSAVSSYLAELPVRYALGVDSPSEVLLHMRLMTAARADPTKAAVHIANVDDGDSVAAGTIRPGSTLRLVTICCADSDGLLEFVARLLGTGGARVLDADVMLTSDGIALDRFVVEMQGRLRLDKLQQYIESYLQEAREQANAAGAMANDYEKRAVNVATTSRPPKASESAIFSVSTQAQTSSRLHFGRCLWTSLLSSTSATRLHSSQASGRNPVGRPSFSFVVVNKCRCSSWEEDKLEPTDKSYWATGNITVIGDAAASPDLQSIFGFSKDQRSIYGRGFQQQPIATDTAGDTSGACCQCASSITQ